MASDEFEPILRYSATEKSLDFSESLAKRLGQKFDRDAIATQSKDVLEQVFKDLLETLKIDPSSLIFKSGIYSRANTFAALSTSGQNHVVLDMVFDFWVFASTQINMILAAHLLESDAHKKIINMVEDLFMLLVESHRFKQTREHFRPYMSEYADCLNISGAMSRSMILFVLCHEIAHCHLDHIKKVQTVALEYEADKQACKYFMLVVANSVSGRKKHTAYVDIKVAGAPILLMRLLTVFENWLKSNGFDLDAVSSHPKAVDRATRLEEILLSHLNQDALYFLDGMSDALKDLQEALIK